VVGRCPAARPPGGDGVSGGLIIFGHQTKKEFGPTALVTCPNCRNRSYFVLVFVKTWLEYFFIKIFAYRKRHYLLCPICSRGVELKGGQVDAAKRLNEATVGYLNGSVTDEGYRSVLDEVRGELDAALASLSP
jgi:hypothetical protein